MSFELRRGENYVNSDGSVTGAHLVLKIRLCLAGEVREPRDMTLRQICASGAPRVHHDRQTVLWPEMRRSAS